MALEGEIFVVINVRVVREYVIALGATGHWCIENACAWRGELFFKKI